MLNNSSPYWISYVKHVLKWEGGKSSNPNDTAARCVSPGQVHTNKGVTYCTFRSLAAGLGVLPVTYNHFLTMTDQEAAKFIFQFYDSISGRDFPDSVAIFLTESAWGSGPSRAIKHLQDALNDLGKPVAVTGTMNAQTTLAAKQIPEAKLFDQYYRRRYSWLIDYLGNLPSYSMFKQGWKNRLTDFNLKYRPGPKVNGIIAALLAIFFH